MKIEKIQVLNFKSFKNFDLELKKINIILGPNNSGKSNILRFLLLLKQTFISTLESPLILNGNIIRLGTFKDISYQFKTSKLNVEYILSNPYEILFHYGQDYEIDKSIEDVVYNIKIEYELNFKLNKVDLSFFYIKSSNKKIPFLECKKNEYAKLNNQPIESYTRNFRNILDKIVHALINFPKIEFTSKKTLYKGLSTIAKSLDLNIEFPDIQALIDHYIMYFKDLMMKQNIITLNVQGKFPRITCIFNSYERNFQSFERFIRFLKAPWVRKNLGDFISSDSVISLKNSIGELNRILRNFKDFEEYITSSSETLENLRDNFGYFFEHLYYIGPLRKYPERYYSLTYETANDVGYKGEFFPHLLKDSMEKEHLKKVFERVNFWLKSFEMAKQANIKQYKEIQELLSIMFEEFYTGLNVNISDMGVGTSQILPIIIEGLIIKENSILLIEQPEIHLHPKVQASLGDLFIELANDNKYLIIETHSEHLFQRIQRRIAEGKISNNDVIFYYITMGKDGSEIQKLELDKNGYIEEIPDGFFDEDYQDAYEHLITTLEKDKKKK